MHQLVGDRAGTWSLSRIGELAITLTTMAGEVLDLDLEDYP